MVRFSVQSARALAFLNRPYNDVDIFIEDSTCHNMILFILKIIIGESIKLETLNQLGGREEVLKACKLDQDDTGRKKLYIIDGDLDEICGIRKPNLKYLYRLKCYCFENLILSEKSILNLAAEIDTNTPPGQISAKLGYGQWMETVVSRLIPLFIVYGVVRKIAPDNKNVGYSVFKLCRKIKSGHELDKTKINSRIRSLMRATISASSLEAVITTRKECSSRLASSNMPRHFVISAKDYIIPILLTRVSKLVGQVGKEDQFKTRLARLYDPKTEPYLARRLRAVVSN